MWPPAARPGRCPRHATRAALAGVLLTGAGPAIADLAVELDGGPVSVPAPEGYVRWDGDAREARRAVPRFLQRRLGGDWLAVLAEPGAVERASREWHPARKAEALGLVGVVQALPGRVSPEGFAERRRSLAEVTERVAEAVSRTLLVRTEADRDALPRFFLERPAEIPPRLRGQLLPLALEQPGPDSFTLLMLHNSSTARGGHHSQGLALCVVAGGDGRPRISVAWSAPLDDIAGYDRLRQLARRTVHSLESGAAPGFP